MLDFTYYAPTKVVFGKESQSQIGALVKKQGCKKVLIHYGGGSVVRSGLLDRVKAVLTGEGVEYVELGGVKPNPRLSLVYEGIELCNKENVDFVLAVGGGSTIDSAKAIALGVVNGGDVWDFYDFKRSAPAGALPVGVVLTIAAAGSEMSNGSVVTKDEGGVKRGFGCEYMRPKFAVMDPNLTMTLPDYQTACGCADILMHTMERYFGNGEHSVLTDRIAESLMKTVIENAVVLAKEPDNYNARAEIMWAGSLSHNDLTELGGDGGDWCTHQLEHELGGMFDVAHGAGLAAVWGTWARYVLDNCTHRFQQYAVNVLDIEDSGTPKEVALKGIEKTEEFFRTIGMPTSIGDMGIAPTEEQLNTMADMCFAANGGPKGSAKLLDRDDLYNIYKAAL